LKLIICIILTTLVISPHFAFAEIFQVSIAQGSSSSGSGCQDIPNCYDPAKLFVKLNDKVTWTNQDSSAHTVTSGTPQDGSNGIFNSGFIPFSQTFMFTFEDGGYFPYFCLIHPWMEGSVMVTIPVGGEFIPLDTTMVLVAGTHTAAAWMIPVIVSAIGIGIVIARKF